MKCLWKIAWWQFSMVKKIRGAELPFMRAGCARWVFFGLYARWVCALGMRAGYFLAYMRAGCARWAFFVLNARWACALGIFWPVCAMGIFFIVCVHLLHGSRLLSLYRNQGVFLPPSPFFLHITCKQCTRNCAL